MSNIQELMTRLILAPRPTQRQRYVGIIRPERGAEIRTILMARSAAHARLRVLQAARKSYERFSFSVRPL